MLLSVAEARIAKAASKLRVLIDTSLTNGAVYVKDVAMFRGIVISLETLLLDRVFSLSPSRFFVAGEFFGAWNRLPGVRFRFSSRKLPGLFTVRTLSASGLPEIARSIRALRSRRYSRKVSCGGGCGVRIRGI